MRTLQPASPSQRTKDSMQPKFSATPMLSPKSHGIIYLFFDELILKDKFIRIFLILLLFILFFYFFICGGSFSICWVQSRKGKENFVIIINKRNRGPNCLKINKIPRAPNNVILRKIQTFNFRSSRDHRNQAKR